MKNRVISILVLVLSLWASSAVAAQKAAPKTAPVAKKEVVTAHRIIIQLSTADTLEYKGLLNNLKHLKEGWGDSVQIEVVVHGPGLDMLTRGKATQEEAVQMMIKKGVQFVACRNTMKQKGVTDDQLLPNVGFVDMGIGEIVRRQEQGWTYIKAGF
jgi:uncharacterized protein